MPSRDLGEWGQKVSSELQPWALTGMALSAHKGQGALDGLVTAFQMKKLYCIEIVLTKKKPFHSIELI
jgi:hypothetical protein